jgi:hypothetical protein
MKKVWKAQRVAFGGRSLALLAAAFAVNSRRG